MLKAEKTVDADMKKCVILSLSLSGNGVVPVYML
jgi:hypothetical protein